MSLGGALWSTLLGSAKNSSIAGLNNAAKAESKVRSLCWLVVFSVLLFFTCRGIWRTVVDYGSHPFITSTDLTFEPLVVFPAVTVCNLNRVHCLNLLTEEERLLR